MERLQTFTSKENDSANANKSRLYYYDININKKKVKAFRNSNEVVWKNERKESQVSKKILKPHSKRTKFSKKKKKNSLNYKMTESCNGTFNSVEQKIEAPI